MIFLRGFIKNQEGFTLIEMLVALAITGLIGTGITMSIFQVFNINALTSDRVIAITEVENAGYWIRRDAMMAQNIIVDTEAALTLVWAGYESAGNKVSYTHADGELLRQVTTYDSSGMETATSQMLVAKHTAIAIDGVTVTITASVGDVEEARTYELLY